MVLKGELSSPLVLGGPQMATQKSPMDMINQLTMGQKVIAGGGILLLIASILPWHHYNFGLGIPGASVTVNRNAWQSPDAIWSILAVLIGVIMAAVIIARVANVNLPELGSITWGQAMLGAGGAVIILVIIKFLAHTGNLGIGFFLGFIAAVALAAGGYLMYTEERGGQGFAR